MSPCLRARNASQNLGAKQCATFRNNILPYTVPCSRQYKPAVCYVEAFSDILHSVARLNEPKDHCARTENRERFG